MVCVVGLAIGFVPSTWVEVDSHFRKSFYCELGPISGHIRVFAAPCLHSRLSALSAPSAR